MRPVPSQSVWTLLPASERNAVTEAIVRVLTEVVENERLNQDPTNSPETPRPWFTCGSPLPSRSSRTAKARINQRSFETGCTGLGWRKDQIVLIDEDQGQSGKQAVGREGFQRLVADVSLRKVGIIMGYEVSRVSRNCADWHPLLELCGLFDTLIADADGIYNPRDFNDRLLLGLKGTLAEAELHSLRLRLDAGRLSKAGRGELRNPSRPGSSVTGTVSSSSIPIRASKVAPAWSSRSSESWGPHGRSCATW